MSLQEVDEFYFPILVEELRGLDLDGVFQKHREHSTQGLATFYNTKKFKMEKTVSYRFNEILAKLIDLDKFRNSNKHNQRIVQLTMLRELETGKHLAVGL